MAKPTFAKSAMPSCAKPSICRPRSLGAGADPSSPGSLLSKRRKLHDLAIRGAIMRKLLHIAFGILRHQQPFNPTLAFVPKTV